jgi:hypothetical protein
VEAKCVELSKPVPLDCGRELHPVRVACEDLEDALRALGKSVELHVTDARSGRDSFLLEEEQHTPIVRRFLNADGTGG